MRILGLKPMSTWDRMENIMKIMQDTSVLQKRQIQAPATEKINDKNVITETTGNLLNKIS